MPPATSGQWLSLFAEAYDEQTELGLSCAFSSAAWKVASSDIPQLPSEHDIPAVVHVAEHEEPCAPNHHMRKTVGADTTMGLWITSPVAAHVASSNDSRSGGSMHSLAPPTAERPGGHAAQVAEPLPLAKDRGGQLMHAADVLEPVSGLNVPTGQ